MSQDNRSSYQKTISKPFVSWFFVAFILIAVLIVLLFSKELPTNQQMEDSQIEYKEDTTQ